MAALYVYLVVSEIIVILLAPGSEACSCGSFCTKYQNELDRCRCCHYYQVGGKRSVDISPEHVKENTASDAQDMPALNSVEELVDSDDNALEKRAPMVTHEYIPTPLFHSVPLLFKNILEHKIAHQVRSWPYKTQNDDLLHFLPAFATRTNYNQLVSQLAQIMARNR